MGGEKGVDGNGIKMGMSEGSSDHKKDDGKGNVGWESWVESSRSDIIVAVISRG